MSYDDYTQIRDQLQAVCRWLESIDQTVGVDLDDQKRSDLSHETSQAVEGLWDILTFIKLAHGFEYREQRGWY